MKLWKYPSVLIEQLVRIGDEVWNLRQELPSLLPKRQPVLGLEYSIEIDERVFYRQELKLLKFGASTEITLANDVSCKKIQLISVYAENAVITDLRDGCESFIEWNRDGYTRVMPYHMCKSGKVIVSYQAC